MKTLNINKAILRHLNKYWALYFVLFCLLLTWALYIAVEANEVARYKLNY